MLPTSRPTYIRFVVVLVTAVAAVFMYVDRACLSQVRKAVQSDLALSDLQTDLVLGSFFLSYAIFQVPAGLLGARVGFRIAFTFMLLTWSLFTIVCGLAMGFWALFLARILVGVAEAGAYPNAAAIVKNWFPITGRGVANSLVSLGGRAGWAVSQLLTPLLVAGLATGFLAGWRAVLILYGILGCVWAAIYWFTVRDKPSEHPWSNAAEAKYAGDTAPSLVASQERLDYEDVAQGSALDLLAEPQQADPTKPLTPKRSGFVNVMLSIFSLMCTRNMWLSGFMQFGVNVAWIFLLTNLPKYLDEVHHQSPNRVGLMSAFPGIGSCFAMFFGGFVADMAIRRLGRRWGRSLPIGTMLFCAAMCYFSCAWMSNVWVIVCILTLAAMCNDVGIPSVWAFAQDVGGKKVGAALGWGNMLGNLGAFVSPVLLGLIQRGVSTWVTEEYSDPVFGQICGWKAVFFTCTASFILAGVSAMLLNAKKPIEWLDEKP